MNFWRNQQQNSGAYNTQNGHQAHGNYGAVHQHRAPGVNRQFGADRIGINGFHERAFVISKPTDAFQPWQQTRIRSLPGRATGRCTNLVSGIEQAIGMLDHAPQGQRKRIWLVSDGLPNYPHLWEQRVPPLLRAARERWININAVAVGNTGDANRELLRAITAGTHNGCFFEVHDLQQLRAALGVSGATAPRNHRAETTIFTVDCSLSMTHPVGNAGMRKIDLVVEALMALLGYKQAVWS